METYVSFTSIHPLRSTEQDTDPGQTEKCLSLAKMLKGNSSSLIRSCSCAHLEVLYKSESCQCTYQNIRWSLGWVCQKKHSLFSYPCGVGKWDRVRMAAEETGMFFCLSEDLFSPPGMNIPGKRELKATCTCSVTSDHMVCSVPCMDVWQFGRPQAPEGPE